jgi:hypothetical protein
VIPVPDEARLVQLACGIGLLDFLGVEERTIWLCLTRDRETERAITQRVEPEVFYFAFNGTSCVLAMRKLGKIHMWGIVALYTSSRSCLESQPLPS